MNETYFYKGVYKVKVLTKSEGYRIIEALEDFEDYSDGKRVAVKTGEERIVPSHMLHRKKVLSPPIPEHVYELKQEKKVKRIVETYKQENGSE